MSADQNTPEADRIPLPGDIRLPYRNHEGRISERHLRFTGRMAFTKNEWHRSETWLLEAYDLDRPKQTEPRLFEFAGFVVAAASLAASPAGAVSDVAEALKPVLSEITRLERDYGLDLPDHQLQPLMISMGELRAIRALIQQPAAEQATPPTCKESLHVEPALSATRQQGTGEVPREVLVGGRRLENTGVTKIFAHPRYRYELWLTKEEIAGLAAAPLPPAPADADGGER